MLSSSEPCHVVSVRLGHGVGGFLATGVEQEKGEGLGVSVE